MVYRDASYTQLIDRYKAKWDMFAKLTQASRDQFVAIGVGLVTDPMPKAGVPVLGTESATGQPGGTFYVCVTWLNAAGQEGSPSDPESITVAADNGMTVMASSPPSNATGFNVYVGTVLAMMTLQNTTPVGLGGSFSYVPGASSSSQMPGTGQKPDLVKALPSVSMRG